MWLVFGKVNKRSFSMNLFETRVETITPVATGAVRLTGAVRSILNNERRERAARRGGRGGAAAAGEPLSAKRRTSYLEFLLFIDSPLLYLSYKNRLYKTRL